MTKRFTAIVAIYNVEEYIEAFLESLDRQAYPISDIEVIGVDDGSSDSSGALFENWSRGRPNIKYIKQENGGPGAARATALKYATGDWVTVADPDDILDDRYFLAVSEFIDRDVRDSASLLSSRLYILNDSTGDFSDSHPLGKKFRFGDRLAKLAEEPEAFQLGATAFFRRIVLAEHDLTYNPEIRPTFEDAHLIGRYLATFSDPVIGLVSTAHYYYRKRSTRGSLVQSSWSTKERYLNTPRLGYLDLLKRVAWNGSAPVWAQYMVLYDLIWFFKEDQNMTSKVAWLDPATRAEFLDIVDRIMVYIDASTIERFACNPHPWILRQSMLVRFGSTTLERVRLYAWSRDSNGVARFSFLYHGARPELHIYSDGTLSDDHEINFTNHRYFGDIFMTEESIKVAGTEIAFFVDGRSVRPSTFDNPVWVRPDTRNSLTLARNEEKSRNGKRELAVRIHRRYRVRSLTTSRPMFTIAISKLKSKISGLASAADVKRSTRRTAETEAYSRSSKARSLYSGCWVVMDRPDKADDNGEHFYRYLLNKQTDVNAYFLLSRRSADWSRLESEGFRLLEFGSKEAVAASMNSAFRISSDATADVMYPAPRRKYGQPPGEFIFLQHGVIKDDLSRWLNPKAIRLIITTTRREYDSFVGPDSYYRFPRNNIALTGLARYDTLLELSRATSKSAVLVMPTWRLDVRDLLEGTPAPDRLRVFEESDYGSIWLALLRSKRLREVCERLDLVIDLIWHPALWEYLEGLQLPHYVRSVNLVHDSFQDAVARARLFITDYSSLAFDAAYIGTPSVYYQFDSAAFFSGAHSYRAGYFDYETEGFGPVIEEESAAVATVGRMLDPTDPLRTKYLKRAEESFEWIDTSNRERIFQAIVDL